MSQLVLKHPDLKHEDLKFNTVEVHAGEPRDMYGALIPPIYQTSTFYFDSTDDAVKACDDYAESFAYSRITNPSVDYLEQKLAALEHGKGAVAYASGMGAVSGAIFALLKSGDHAIFTKAKYSGTEDVTSDWLPRFGIAHDTFDAADLSQLEGLIKPNTKLIFGETIANPALTVFDIEKFAKIAHAHQIPLIVDNTFATPILCRPIEFGADIVIHSTTKYMDGHALQCGGVIVDGGTFDWEKSGKFPDFTEPDESYHGVVYTREFGKMAYIIKARMQLMRDFGCYPAAHSAFLLNLGLETLPVRMKQYCENAMAVAKMLKQSDKIASVTYPNLPDDPYHEMAKKYLPNGTCGVISISIKGGREAAVRFMDALQLASIEVHVADIRTCVLHPASATHRQLTEEQLKAAGIDGGLIRISVGLENIEDILADLQQALERV